MGLNFIITAITLMKITKISLLRIKLICEEKRRENAERIEREISLEMYHEKTRNCKKRKERITGEETIAK